jgi:hypothetical protein
MYQVVSSHLTQALQVVMTTEQMPLNDTSFSKKYT